MIHNEHERRVTRRKHAELTATLQTRSAAAAPKGRNSEMHQLVTDGIRAQLDDLQAELTEYADLNLGATHVDLPDLEGIGEQLIRARIAAGLSQKELALLAGLAEGVVRRYERERYASTSVSRVSVVAQVLRARSTSGFTHRENAK